MHAIEADFPEQKHLESLFSTQFFFSERRLKAKLRCTTELLREEMDFGVIKKMANRMREATKCKMNRRSNLENDIGSP